MDPDKEPTPKVAPLQHQAVYKWLDWQWSFYGITLWHLLVIASAPTCLMMLATLADVTGMLGEHGDKIIYLLPTVIPLAIVVLGLQYDRPTDYLQARLMRLRQWRTPPVHALSPFVSTSEERPLHVVDGLS
jgi:hypothetical protein